jgi:hypothetical protein
MYSHVEMAKSITFTTPSFACFLQNSDKITAPSIFCGHSGISSTSPPKAAEQVGAQNSHMPELHKGKLLWRSVVDRLAGVEKLWFWVAQRFQHCALQKRDELLWHGTRQE